MMNSFGVEKPEPLTNLYQLIKQGVTQLSQGLCSESTTQLTSQANRPFSNQDHSNARAVANMLHRTGRSLKSLQGSEVALKTEE